MRRRRALSVAAALLITSLSAGASLPAPVHPLPNDALANVTADANGGELAPDTCERGNPQYLPDTPQAYELLGLDRAKELATGKGVLVAVVDSGVDARNAHLGSVVRAGHDFAASGDGRTDIEGHGTAVAGIIAAQPVEGSGLIGVAHDAEILPVRVYEASEKQQSGQEPVLPNLPMTSSGIRWAADNGAKIIAVALSSASDDPELAAAVQYATERGALVVASAGNRQTAAENERGDSIRYPAGYDQVLSVTSISDQGEPTDAAIHGVHVGVAAPGQNVPVSWFNDGDCRVSPDYPSTSFATGYAAGVAALVASAHPDEGPAMWKWRLESTALRASPSDREDLLGWGVLAPYDAITVTPDAQRPGPLLPGGQRTAPPAQAGQLPPRPGDDPVAVRAAVGTVVTGAGALGGALLWLRARRQQAAPKTVRR